MYVDTEFVYTLDDLRNWPNRSLFKGTALAVVGHPIAHSLSPAMHNAALQKLAQTDPQYADWRYFKFDIPPEGLGEALRLFSANNFLGLNLTVPHKTLALDYIYPEAATVEDAGAANTLKFVKEFNRWHGYNTDGYGLRHALKDKSVEIRGSDVILLGAGGAARGAALECLVWQCESLRILNRTRPTIDLLIDHLKKSTACNPLTQLLAFDFADPGLHANAIVINATSLGLKNNDESPLDLTRIPRPAFVFDMIYRPAETRLLKQAAEMGIPFANGLSMLVHQGAQSLRHWTGIESVPVDVMQRAVNSALISS
jgi:shikimate dehydrogenase